MINYSQANLLSKLVSAIENASKGENGHWKSRLNRRKRLRKRMRIGAIINLLVKKEKEEIVISWFLCFMMDLPMLLNEMWKSQICFKLRSNNRIDRFINSLGSVKQSGGLNAWFQRPLTTFPYLLLAFSITHLSFYVASA